MRKITFVLGLCLFSVSARVGADDFAVRRDQNWHQWRGPLAGGVARHGQPPVTWNETTNLKWKTKIPGEGSSTPIVWENRVFVVAAIETDRVAPKPPKPHPTAKTQQPSHIFQFAVICLDRTTGNILWRRTACEDVPHEGRHPTNSFASASPTTDGRYLYVSFGSRGIYCFDLDGNFQWKRDLGNMRTRYGWGEATSPVIHGESIVVNWDHEDQSFIAVLDAQSGKTKWKVDRDEPTTWATPLVTEHKGRKQTIVNGTNRVRSYDLATGKIIWQCGGQTLNAIPSPVLSNGVVYCMSGYKGSAAYAIPLDVTGDVTDSDKIIWKHDTGTPYVPSPIIYGDRMYFTYLNSNVLSCLEVATGKPVFQRKRIPGLSNVYASPVAADGRIYFVGRNGTTVVIKHDTTLKVLATNRLNEPIDASPAIAGNQLFLRGTKHLYCFESQGTP
jgi:outer membrane protein assembly factor BamB